MRTPSSAISFVLSALSVIGLARAGLASPLVYTPVNPAFGGNPLNANAQLGVANAINKYTAPTTGPASGSVTSQAEQFVRQLQSRLLSSLSANVTNAIFGENPQEHGEIVFGDQIITFDRGIDAVDITILDTATGETTRVSVPIVVGSR